MAFINKTFCLEVTSPYACFTRPEMKVERVSYDIITPSAARGVFDAIFWKPAIRWKIKKIEVLNPIAWVSVRRNEVAALANARIPEIFIEDKRQQRAGLLLRDVAYRLYAELEFIPVHKRVAVNNPVSTSLLNSDDQELKQHCAEVARVGKDENPGKYHAIFERRARKGQCFNQPYLGCREFSCDFRWVDLVDGVVSVTEPLPIKESKDFGFMLYDIDFSIDKNNPMPAFFRPQMVNGVIAVPDWNSEEVLK